MSREKKLLKNFGILSLGSISVKVFSFLLIPLYTRYLSTNDFGLFELVITTVGLMIPIVTLDIADATLRFAMDDNVNKGEIYRISLKYCFGGTISIACLLAINHFVRLISLLVGIEFFVIALFLLTALSGVLVGYAKALNKVKSVAVSGVLSTLVTVFFNVFFLVIINKGIIGYFWSYALGIAVQVVYLGLIVNGFKEGLGKINDKELEHAALRYSLPLIVNNVAWWANSALDRYIVTFFCGISENGIYSLGYKIPTIISMIQSIFHQAWTLSAIQEYNSGDANRFFKSTYKAYNFVLLMACSVIILANKTVAKIMYSNEFYEAWRYVPYLCIGFVFLGLANYIGGFFNALKNTKIIAMTTALAAMLNCILNICLIPRFGALGAAFATAISYMSIWLIRLYVVKQKMNITLFSVQDGVAYVILFISTIDVIYENIKFSVVHFLVIIVLGYIYRVEASSYIKKLLEKK